MWVPCVRAVKPLNSNNGWIKWHTGKKNFASGHTGVLKLFSGTQVSTIFHNGIHVKDSIRCRMTTEWASGISIHGSLLILGQWATTLDQ